MPRDERRWEWKVKKWMGSLEEKERITDTKMGQEMEATRWKKRMGNEGGASLGNGWGMGIGCEGRKSRTSVGSGLLRDWVQKRKGTAETECVGRAWAD